MYKHTLLALVAAPALALAQPPRSSPADSALAHDIFRELIAIPSVSATSATVDAARAMVGHLRAAGFSEDDARVIEAGPGRGSVYARLRGRSGAAPVLLLAHLDVVPALKSDWSTDPFVLTDSAGWWYGRGTIDDKHAVAILTANFARWKRAGWQPSRDLIFIATADEENDAVSIQHFITGPGRSLIGNPEYALNFDAGGGVIHGGREAVLEIQTSEKIYVTYELRARNPGGHSSVPRADNPIYELARALTRLAEHRFPVQLTETTRLYLQRAAAFEPDTVASRMRAVASSADDAAAAWLSRIPFFNAQLRTTCVATQLAGGHAENALPQTATATVNCRVIPGSDTTVVRAALTAAVADPSIEIVEIDDLTPSEPSPLTPALVGALERVARRFWPGVVIIPAMSTGATDGLYVRNVGIPVYGVDATFAEPTESRAHGRDERIEIRRYFEDFEWARALVEELFGAVR